MEELVDDTVAEVVNSGIEALIWVEPRNVVLLPFCGNKKAVSDRKYPLREVHTRLLELE
jgi:hypothetical protein